MQVLDASAPGADRGATAKVLVIGEIAVTCAASDGLEPRGYELRRAGLGDGGERRWADVIVLKTQGADPAEVVDFCRRNRSAGGPPLIVLHAHADPDLGIASLEAGADDSLLPPHNPREVVARVRALLRRQALQRMLATTHVRVSGLSIDLMKRRAETPTGGVNLTENQARLLSALLARPGEVVPRQVLLDAMLGPNGEAFDRTVDVQVCRLKKRLAKICEAELIGSYRGVGYRLNVQGSNPGRPREKTGMEEFECAT